VNVLQPFINRVTEGDCIHVLRRFPDRCVDFVLTDPPSLVRYQDRNGRTVINDDNPRWLFPAFAEIYRVLRHDRYCVSFYGWGKAEKLLAVWKELGLFPVGHFVFVKPYASRRGHTQMRHEQAYLLAKGRPQPPGQPPPDVIEFDYPGNDLHPTQKPVTALMPLIMAYSEAGDLVLDPFAGSGSTGIAARETSRRFVLIEKDRSYARKAQDRLSGSPLSSTR
jgi:adenine-specific DNA-methyltransferase